MPSPQETADLVRQYRKAIEETRVAIARDQGVLSTVNSRLTNLTGCPMESVDAKVHEWETELASINTRIAEKLAYIQREFPL